VIDHHGPDVDQFIADRMTALAGASDEAGVAAWRAIALRVDELRRVPSVAEPRH